MKCKQINKNNLPCRAYAMRGMSYCFRHISEHQDAALQASSRGGKGNQQYHCLGSKLSVKNPTPGVE